MTAAEELVLIDNCITKILNSGQAYGVDGRTLTRADLKTLWDRKQMLETSVAQVAGTTVGRTYAKQGGRDSGF